MRPVSKGIFEMDEKGPVLIGARRRSDNSITFPFPVGPYADEYEQIVLPRVGTLWTYTVQRFRPKYPFNDGLNQQAEFKPFAVGYVQLDGYVIVESRIVATDFAALKVGAPMQLVLEQLREDPDGVGVMTCAFSPLSSDSTISRIGAEQ